MPTTTRCQLGAAGSREEVGDEASDGSEEHPPASLDTLLAAITGIQQHLAHQEARFVALECADTVLDQVRHRT